jgi:ABC-2 type transport system ATP-binding protein
MIEARHLSKRFGATLAVDDVSFTVHAGAVTAFLGPNGAGKSTMLRLMLGLIHGDGTSRFDGQLYRDLIRPACTVGVVLEAAAVHPRRTARAHLRMLAAAAGIDKRCVNDVLDEVGLLAVAAQPAGQLSLGMLQRLALAAALIGSPSTLILDEPANGLDAHGVAWLRDLLRAYADNGGSVLVSSHLLAEVELLADHVIVLSRGKVLADEPIDRLLARRGPREVTVRTPDAGRLAELLSVDGAIVERCAHDVLTVSNTTTEAVGDTSFRHRVRIHELTSRTPTLEDVFLQLIGSGADHTPGPSAP